MRLLVVGHSYLTAFAQRKYVEMKHQREEIELRILTPRAISHIFQHYTREIAPGLTNEEVIDIREFFGKSHMSYIFEPSHFIKVLTEFQPNWIHIEEDPYSAVGIETVFLAGLFCSKAKVSFFIWDNLAREPRFPLNLIKWTLNRYSLARTTLVVCGNKEAQLLLHGKKGYKGRSAVLPQLGLDQDFYLGQKNTHLRKVLNIPENVLLIGYIGRLIPEKGIILLFEALLQLMHLHWSFIIVGSGPLEEQICRKWQPLLGDRLILCKAVPHAEVPAYIRSLDIFVLPSYTTKPWKEQFGLVLAQAMLAGVPCIGSSSGAIPDVIGPGGLVFREKDADDLARNLKSLLINDHMRKSLAESAQKFALKHYTHEAVVTEYLKQFEGHTCVNNSLSIEKPNTKFTCPSCASISSRVYLENLTDLFHGVSGTWDLQECMDCGLIYTIPFVPENQIGDYYPDNYVPYGKGPKRSDSPIVQFLRQAAILPYTIRFGQPGYSPMPFGNCRLLEVGCGTGRNIEKMLAAGWQCTGLDISRLAIESAQMINPGARFIVGTINDLDESKKFDMIVMHHVLEHLYYPREVLKTCFNLLQPGGVLVINVPNIGSFEARWFGRTWKGLDMPRHTLHFKETVIDQLLKDSGFTINHKRPDMFASSISESCIMSLPVKFRRRIINSRIGRIFYFMMVPIAALSYALGNRGTLEIMSTKNNI